MESYFRTLKVGRVGQLRYDTRHQAWLDIVNWIEGWYNQGRLHRSIDYRMPAGFDQGLFAA